MPEIEDMTQLERLEARHDELVNELASHTDKRDEARVAFEKREKSEDAKPSDEERSAFVVAEEEFNKDFDRREAEIKSLERRIREEQVKEERRQAAARAASPRVSITHQPLTYRKDNGLDTSDSRGHSYFRDLAARFHGSFASQFDDTTGAMERLERHGKEMAEEMPKREAARERRAQEQIDRAEKETRGSIAGMVRRGLDENPFERRTNPNRTDGQGGYFVPPLWLIDEYIPYLRAGRPAAELCRQMDLPAGTDSINIPKLATSTLTGVQTADNQTVTSQDFTDTTVSAGVKTIAGQEDVAIQLIEQSPGQIVDRVVMEDLLADYNKQVDVQVLTGTNASGQVQGLLPVTSWSNANTVTWTDSNPTGFAFNQAMGAAVSKISYNRFNLENIRAVLHPRRWFWFATSSDVVGGASALNQRPLVNASGEFNPFNTVALEQNPTPYQGLAGNFPFGLPVHIDGNMSAVCTTGGAISGGTADVGLVGKFDDFWLFEGSLRTRVLPEILSGTLQIRFQVFNYVAFLVRYGQSISVIIGTGTAAPTATAATSITF